MGAARWLAAAGAALVVLTATPDGRQALADITARDTVSVTESGGHTAYAFTFADAAGPGRWSPCQPIHVVVSSANLPAGGYRLVTRAVAEVRRASGLPFVVDGTTPLKPTAGRLDHTLRSGRGSSAPVLIGWVHKGETDMLSAESGSEDGNTGVVATRHQTARGTVRELSSAVVALDADVAVGDLARPVLLHELGHVAGLAHVSDTAEIMQPAPDYGQGLSHGDRSGLAAAGRGRCW